MKSTSYLVLSFLILIAAACNASPTAPVDDATLAVETGSGQQALMKPPELSLEKLSRRVAGFEHRGNDLVAKHHILENQEPYLALLRRPRGYTADLRFDATKYLILAANLEIIRVEYRDLFPRDFTSETNGWTDTETLRTLAVKISADEARNAAKQYVESHWNRPILEGLAESEPYLFFDGSRYRYSIDWSLQATGEEILYGVRQISVDVNPATGEVFTVNVMELEPPETSKIGPEEFLQMVETEFGTLQDLVVNYIQISKTYPIETPERSTWMANIRFTCPEDLARNNPLACYGEGTLVIDANSGEILKKSTL